jgi:hypothetical protein
MRIKYVVLLGYIIISLLFSGCKVNDSTAEDLKSGTSVLLRDSHNNIDTNMYVFQFTTGQLLKNPGKVVRYVNVLADSLYSPIAGDLWMEGFSLLVDRNVPSVYDAGIKNLNDVTEAPIADINGAPYNIYVSAEVDHVYVIYTANKKYAKIKVSQKTETTTMVSIVFDWAYQSDGSRNLK